MLADWYLLLFVSVKVDGRKAILYIMFTDEDGMDTFKFYVVGITILIILILSCTQHTHIIYSVKEYAESSANDWFYLNDDIYSDRRLCFQSVIIKYTKQNFVYLTTTLFKDLVIRWRLDALCYYVLDDKSYFIITYYDQFSYLPVS